MFVTGADVAFVYGFIVTYWRDVKKGGHCLPTIYEIDSNFHVRDLQGLQINNLCLFKVAQEKKHENH